MLLTRLRNMAMVAVALAVLGPLFSTNASAQPLNKKTTITTNQPLQIPGVVLPAGKYVMKVVDIAGNRHIVRFLSADETKVYATLLGIPDYKLETPSKTEFSFYEARPGIPQPLRAWFYPGSNYGTEFVYPKSKAVEIAKASGEYVVATAAEQQPTEQNLIQEQVFEVQPNGNEIALNGAEVPLETIVPEPPLTPPMAAEVPETLPKTATPFALLGLAGILAASVAAAVRVGRKHFE